MLVKFIIENFGAFSKEVEFDLEADLRIKKLSSNVIKNGQGNIVKSVGIYGPNNTGKTCLIQGINGYQNVLLNKRKSSMANIFSGSKIYKLGAVFIQDETRYSYYFRYNAESKSFIEEEFKELQIDQYGNEKTLSYFYRNTEKNTSDSSSQKLKDVINIASKDNILIHTLNTSELPLLEKAKKVLREFADKMIILSMNKIQPHKTIEILKDSNSIKSKQITELIKNADLDIEDFKYDEQIKIKNINFANEENEDSEVRDDFLELLRLTSIHKGKPLPSIIYDSLGTKKIVALAGYIVEAINEGKVLIIDELDAGIHYKLSRSIVSLFNSIKNEKSQLIFSTHDVTLLDIRTLFRKEQIWFTDKDENQVYLYPLSAFTTENSGIRSESNVMEYYSKGLLGAVQEPFLVNILLMEEDGDMRE